MNVKNLVLGVGIFIVYLLVLNYGIEAFYPSPLYEDFCVSRANYYSGESYPVKPVGIGGGNCTVFPTLRQSDECMQRGGSVVASTYDSNDCPLTYECDMCQKEFNDASKGHSQVVFIISLIAGIITLIVGYTILSVEPVGSALMASGVGAFVYGSIVNWQNLSNIWKFMLLAVALVLMIWIALRINRESKKGFLHKLGLAPQKMILHGLGLKK